MKKILITIGVIAIIVGVLSFFGVIALGPTWASVLTFFGGVVGAEGSKSPTTVKVEKLSEKRKREREAYEKEAKEIKERIEELNKIKEEERTAREDLEAMRELGKEIL